jgi:hypothetical protein
MRDVAAAEGPVLLRQDAIVASVATRLHHHHALRREHVIDIARTWEHEMPTRFRIAFTKAPERVSEIRLVSSKGRPLDDPTWDGWEQRVSLVCTELITTKKRTSLRNHVIAWASLHALGRWHQRQRSQDANEAHLVADLAALRYPERFGARGFTVTLPDGKWSGEIVGIQNKSTGALDLVLGAKSFLELRDTATA